jgi:hypothetical protein
MGKFMKMGVVSAVMLCAAGAFASNFRVADQVYVPVAGHIASARLFLTDVYISNVEDDSVDVSVMYIDASGIKQFPKFLTLAPRERREIIDFVGAPASSGGLGQSGIGQLVFNGCKAGQDCTPDPTTGVNANFRNISVETRIYSIDPALASSPTTAPSNGQLFAGLPWYSYVSSDSSAAGLDKVFVTGLRNTGSNGQTGTYRTNLGFANASQFSTTTLLVKLFDGKTGTQIGTDKTVTLGPLQIAQPGVGALFSSFTGPTATNAYVTVEQVASATQPTSDAAANGCTNGCPAFFAWGSLLDNTTNDAITLEAQYLKPLTNAAINCVYNLTCKGAYNPRRASKSKF